MSETAVQNGKAEFVIAVRVNCMMSLGTPFNAHSNKQFPVMREITNARSAVSTCVIVREAFGHKQGDMTMSCYLAAVTLLVTHLQHGAGLDLEDRPLRLTAGEVRIQGITLDDIRRLNGQLDAGYQYLSQAKKELEPKMNENIQRMERVKSVLDNLHHVYKHLNSVKQLAKSHDLPSLIQHVLRFEKNALDLLKWVKKEDPCTGQPCRNGGACSAIMGGGGFRCSCPLGWIGPTCEVDFDECAVESGRLCKNGGRCVNTVGGFWCNCTNGYVGAYCEQQKDVHHPCSGPAAKCGHGLCLEEGTGGGRVTHRCQCLSGWTHDSPAEPCMVRASHCSRMPYSELESGGDHWCGMKADPEPPEAECRESSDCWFQQRCVQGTCQCPAAKTSEVIRPDVCLKIGSCEYTGQSGHWHPLVNCDPHDS